MEEKSYSGIGMNMKNLFEKPVDISRLSEAEFHEELEKGYADIQGKRIRAEEDWKADAAEALEVQ